MTLEALFQSIAILELGSLAASLKEPLEQKGEHATKNDEGGWPIVWYSSHKNTRYFRSQRRRVQEHLAVLKAVKNKDVPPPRLDPAGLQARFCSGPQASSENSKDFAEGKGVRSVGSKFP